MDAGYIHKLPPTSVVTHVTGSLLFVAESLRTVTVNIALCKVAMLLVHHLLHASGDLSNFINFDILDFPTNYFFM